MLLLDENWNWKEWVKGFLRNVWNEWWPRKLWTFRCLIFVTRFIYWEVIVLVGPAFKPLREFYCLLGSLIAQVFKFLARVSRNIYYLQKKLIKVDIYVVFVKYSLYFFEFLPGLFRLTPIWSYLSPISFYYEFHYIQFKLMFGYYQFRPMSFIIVF